MRRAKPKVKPVQPKVEPVTGHAVARGSRLDAVVRNRWQLSWGKARDHIVTGKIWLDGACVTDIGLLIEDNALLELRMNAPRSKATYTQADEPMARSRVIHVDTQVIVVNKPAGLPTVPYEREQGQTLERQVCLYLQQPKVVVVHRLDRETSGLVVFARHAEAGRALAQQFRQHSVHRRYFALAHGKVRSQTICSLLVEDRGDGLRGSIARGSPLAQDQAKAAVTHVEAVKDLPGMTLIECRLETGRTHQIRIHLSESGHPLVGEKAYIREFSGPKIEASRLMLHAAELGFVHPTREVFMSWKQEWPEDFAAMLEQEDRGGPTHRGT